MAADIKAQVDDMRKKFAAYALGTKLAIVRALTESAILLEDDIKENFTMNVGGGKTHIPSEPGEPPAVDSGRLRGSFFHRMTNTEGFPVAEVGTNVEYAAALEFGTKSGRIKPRPYFIPAMARNDKEIKDKIAQSIKDVPV